MQLLSRCKGDRGATAVEYGVLVGLIIGVVIVTISFIGPALLPGFEAVLNNLP
jgi:Flp pilus assembly pilin Flp